MISEYINLLVSPLAFERSDNFEKEYGGLLERAKSYVDDGGKAHIIVSDDIILPVETAFKKAEGVQISACDFNSIAAIDRAVRKNTVLAYCEYPSARALRSYDFEKISKFLNYFKIKLACGLYFADPCCCGYGENGGRFIKISRSAAIARKIHEIISAKPIFKNLLITRVNSSNYTDYKNNRKLCKIDGCYIKVSGGGLALKAAYGSLCGALNGSGFIKGELGGKIEDYYQLVCDYDNCGIYSLSSGDASKKSGGADECQNDISGFIIKAGTNESLIDKLNRL